MLKMKRKFVSNLKENKKIVKLSMTALVSAAAIYGGISYSASAMKRSRDSARPAAVAESGNSLEDVLIDYTLQNLCIQGGYIQFRLRSNT